MENIKDIAIDVKAYNVEVVEKKAEKLNVELPDAKTSISDISRKQNEKIKFIKPKAESNISTAKSPAGVCTVVNSEKNGKRVMFSKDIMECMDNPQKIEACFTESGIALAKKLPENGVEFNVKKIGNKGAIYCSPFVKEITKMFGLNFENRVSITFT